MLLTTLLHHCIVLAISAIDIGMIAEAQSVIRGPTTRALLQGYYNLYIENEISAKENQDNEIAEGTFARHSLLSNFECDALLGFTSFEYIDESVRILRDDLLTNFVESCPRFL